MLAKSTPFQQRIRLATWVSDEVMPYEPRVRDWLKKRSISPEVADDLLQEAYCRLAALDSTTQISCPHAYFFSIVRNLLSQRLRRLRVVPLETIAEIDAFRDDAPSQERVAAGRDEIAWVKAFMAGLPERCRRVIELRKFEGWSQKRVAEYLGMSEKAVEKQIWIGLRALREARSQSDAAAVERMDQHLSQEHRR
jgi:RNA polymerase sigma factor (sigma-70 family)